MNIGGEEALAILVVGLGLSLLLVPIAGIPRAVKRIGTARRSTSAVVAASIGMALSVLAIASGRLSLFFCLMAAGMNATWLWAGLRANRRAAARRPT